MTPLENYYIYGGKKKITVLDGLKKFMLSKKISVIDLDWDYLKEYNINMQKLLAWELKQRRLTPERRRERNEKIK